MKLQKRTKELTVLLIIMAFCISQISMSLASAEDVTPTNKPTASIVVNGVDKGKTVEVGLSVQSGTNKFQSVGTVLKYDPKIITPIEWTEAGTEIAMVAQTQPKFFAESVPLPTKGADKLSGKTALAFKDADNGYLYLAAEAPITLAGLEQTPPTLTDAVAGTTPAGLPSQKMEELKEVVDQAVTVRFKVNVKTAAIGDTPEEHYSMDEVFAAIDILKDEAPDPSGKPSNAILASSPVYNASGAVYFASNETVADAGKAEAPEMSFLFVTKGVTVNSGGGGSAEGIIAITAFDWDDTMLGSFIFAADKDPAKQQENAQAAMDTFVAQPEIDAILKSHAGYDFLAWVKNQNNVPSSYGKRVLSNSDTTLEDLTIDEENKVDFSTLTQSGTVKAGYVTNANCQTGDGMGVADAIIARQYKTSVDSYGRFGTGNSFSVKIKVERGNVPRSTQGALRVRMNIDGVDVFSQYALSGADSEIIEVAPFAQSASSGVLKGVSLVEWTVIDTYGASNWVNAAARTRVTECQSKAEFTVKSVGTANNIAVWGDGTYPFYGVVASFNDGLREYYELLQQNPGALPSTITVISAAIVRSIGIPPSTANNNNLRKAIYDGWVAQGMQNMDYATLYKIASGT